jgi:hypothetical protein
MLRAFYYTVFFSPSTLQKNSLKMSSPNSVNSTRFSNSITNDPNNQSKQMPVSIKAKSILQMKAHTIVFILQMRAQTMFLATAVWPLVYPKKESLFCDKTYARFNKVRLHINQQHQKEVEMRNKSDQHKYRQVWKTWISNCCEICTCIDTFDTKLLLFIVKP